MECALCNGKLTDKYDTIEFESKTIGQIFVPNIRQTVCEECGDILLTPRESERIISYVKHREKTAIGRLPVSEFASLNEAAKILGVTKQAFSKNPRIKAGLIYSVSIGGRRYYNRKSVEQFMETGNGRYLLPKREVEKVDLIKKWEIKPETLDFVTHVDDEIVITCDNLAISGSGDTIFDTSFYDIKKDVAEAA